MRQSRKWGGGVALILHLFPQDRVQARGGGGIAAKLLYVALPPQTQAGNGRLRPHAIIKEVCAGVGVRIKNRTSGIVALQAWLFHLVRRGEAAVHCAERKEGRKDQDPALMSWD